MKKSSLIEMSVIVVFIFVLSSLVNVIGYQTVQSSKQDIMNNKNNPNELIFQTIADIANNKDIQRIILRSQINRGILPTSELPVVTKNQLKMMYFIGLILSKVISKSRIQSMIGAYQFNNQEILKEISAVIEKDKTLNTEITQLKNSNCDCENEKTAEWRFPIICILLSPLWIVAAILAITSNYGFYFVEIMGYIGMKLNCFWNIVPSKD